MSNEPRSRERDGSFGFEGSSLQLDIRERDPVHQVAREVVDALIDSRWSLHAATVVVALRRLCETVTGTQVDTCPPTSAYLEQLDHCRSY